MKQKIEELLSKEKEAESEKENAPGKQLGEHDPQIGIAT